MATATYPPPPPYYRLYKNYSEDPDSCPAPPPPIEGPYLLYGASYTTDDVLPGLEEQGVRQLYPKGPNIDFKKELRSLNRELQLNILELADVLVERPSQYARRVEDISLIFKNLYHLLNSLRPHQICKDKVEAENWIAGLKALITSGQAGRSKIDGWGDGGLYFDTDDVLPGLEEQGVRQLYPKGPNIDFKKELRSLNRELQLNILELADVLVERPSQYARRVEDISLIFKNLYHLLNSLRPHQARATLIHILELQIQRRRQAVEDIKRRREEAQRLLTEALGTLDGQ